MIPLVNLPGQYKKIKKEILEQIEVVLESCSFIQGEFVSEFENKFASMHEANFGSGCSNGTSAIHLALQALGVKLGDEVITVPNTFFATAEAILHAGAKPVFVDIDSNTHNMDVSQIEAAITDRTRAIMPVHLYGNPADMAPLMNIAKRYGLFVIEDCAQAHLAKYRGQYVGTFGDAATFSFYPGKNLGAYGDAGFVFTRSRAHEAVVRKLLDHGRMSKYEHDMVGYNYRMDEIQAAVLLVKLSYLRKWTEIRRKNAEKYKSLISQTGVSIVQSIEGTESAHHLFVLEVSNRLEVMDYMKSKGVGTSIHYPVPLHLQPALAYLGHKTGDFPVSEAAAQRVLSLPLCAELTEGQVEFISQEFLKIVRP